MGGHAFIVSLSGATAQAQTYRLTRPLDAPQNAEKIRDTVADFTHECIDADGTLKLDLYGTMLHVFQQQFSALTIRED